MSNRQRRKRQLQYKALSWALTAVFVVLFYAIICAFVGNRSFYGKTTINGIDVSGMKVDAAAEAIEQSFKDTYSKAEIEVKLEDKTYKLGVADSLDMDAKKAVQKIQDDTHRFWRRGYGFLESHIVQSSFDVYPGVADRSAISRTVESSDMMKADLSQGDGYTIQDGKLIVTKGSGDYTVDTDKLTSAIVKNLESGKYSTVIDCPVIAIDVDMDKVYAKVHRKAQDPTLDPDKDYQVVEAQDGVDFDLDAAKASLAAAKKGEQISIPLTYTKADMTTDEYKSLLFRDQISSYSTEVEGSDARKTNVELAAKYCDGTILMPGESFSYNEGVGELTEERGFLPGPSYADGQSVMDMGGGICQVSSIFTNDTDYPIKISTSYDGYSTSCTIWGTVTEPFSVELYTETLETEPYETKYELDKTLGKDEQVLDTVGIDGLTIQSYRRVYDADGNVISDNPEAVSVYSKRDEVYKVGKLPKKDRKKTEKTEGDTTEDTSESVGGDSSADKTSEGDGEAEDPDAEDDTESDDSSDE